MSLMKDLKDTIGPLYDKISLTPEDICELANEYEEVLALIEKYKETTLGRKELATQIYQKLMLLEKFAVYLNLIFEEMHKRYDNIYQETINDLFKAIHVILRLANQENNIYSSTQLPIQSVRFHKVGTRREKEEIRARALIIGPASIINSIDNTRIYRPYEISNLATEILNHNASLILLSNLREDYLLKPNTFDHNSALRELRISTFGFTSEMNCYLFDDELAHAIDLLLEFIRNNGADIKDIDEDVLYQNIIKNKALVRVPKKIST